MEVQILTLCQETRSKICIVSRVESSVFWEAKFAPRHRCNLYFQQSAVLAFIWKPLQYQVDTKYCTDPIDYGFWVPSACKSSTSQGVLLLLYDAKSFCSHWNCGLRKPAMLATSQVVPHGIIQPVWSILCSRPQHALQLQVDLAIYSYFQTEQCESVFWCNSWYAWKMFSRCIMKLGAYHQHICHHDRNVVYKSSW